MPAATEPQTKIIKPRTKAGKRALEKRAPKLVEDPKRALLAFGNKTSQVIKDVMTDLQKLKGIDSVKFSRHNPELKPFEGGGEAALERHCAHQNCSLFALGSTQKKRPHNLVMGRLFDFRLYDVVEFGVVRHRPVQAFGGGAALAQLGNKPCFVFVGDVFEADPVMRQVKSLLLDYFRGRQVESINLAGLDRVMFVTQHPETKHVLLRQYTVKYKKSGTRVPRTELTEMGPSLDLEVRRTRQPPVDLEKEACKQPKTDKKKQKNVGSDMLDGKVGHIYMPKQDVDGMALAKPKGTKRVRREAAADASAEKKQRGGGSGAAAAAAAAGDSD
ncbi:ribosome production factor 2-like protein [Micractinium conductrix]|uniref:Ribosome production factor 2 homolog n=1 Tax=Micractinium conductrix TaxID=554055 RepID=A0A2P6VLY5_9CHLO|nr:ribosome production factor 2-like protein [Micractinium conductrix]|eukprot:PSC75116.1 ribosome production factor 2-like protein [Micractinium conductrix]